MRSGHAAGAANRAYYALYQLAVSRLTSKNLTPTTFVAKERLRKPAEEGVSWPHWLIKQCCGAAGFEREQSDLLEDALELRVRADYRPEPLDIEVVRGVVAGARGVVDDLG